MDELIQKVQQRADIDEGQANAAVNTVIDFLKERLPEPIAGQIEGALSDEAGSADGQGREHVRSLTHAQPGS
jgi:uncharacterized protein (DUF2267 family)